MGSSCCGNSKSVKYHHNGRDKIIPGKEAATIERFKNGAKDRWAVKNIKLAHLKLIACLPKPTWDSVQTPGDVQVSRDFLISDAEFDSMYSKREGTANKLSWNNYFTDIGNGREYKGEWTKDGKSPSGLGIVKFADGSEYRG